MRGFSQSIKRKRCHSVALLLFFGGACGASSGIRVVTSVRQSRGTRNCSPTQKKINDISLLNNFRFYPGGMRVWQTFDKGPGKCISLEGTNGKLYVIFSFQFLAIM